MKEKFQKYADSLKIFWQGRTKKSKTVLIATVLLVLLGAGTAGFLMNRTTFVPLYSNLSPTETGTIKESLDGRGIPSEITDGGGTIKVPEGSVDTLKVELAAEGLPKSGSIDYSFFSQNAGLGMTDNEFNVLKVEAMQTELAELMKGVEGVKDAKVMINLPEKSIFVSDAPEKASASIVLNTIPGNELKDEQVQALYRLVEKSVPNLPEENIVIMNQFSEYFDLKNRDNSSETNFASQHEVKQQVQRDVQRQVQSMLGTLMGQEKVVVSVTADIDFTQENREENLVEPVDKENMEGIAISAQRLTETFSGKGEQAGGVPSGQDPADSLGSQYLESSGGNGDYEKKEETINKEVNRIRKEIVESPYKVRDLGIQVMVEPPKPNDPNSLPQERIDDISKILGTIVRTTIDKQEGTELTDELIEQKIAVSVQPFNGKIKFDEAADSGLPWWVYVVGGVLLAAVIILLFLFVKSRQKEIEPIEAAEDEEVLMYVPDVNTEKENESSLKKKQLEKMAKEKPEDFAKLLRTWLSED
ncbi:flagellar basal-body MS-ring/collar protein FliF [Mesobacillus zeae]|uniref:Flagellar M-ring protein n=1 Tax=Mesobacillus zeae TaxID=1917180 RepID=A0A398BFF8_9BACI|nr:flagellar basal-body MS-ring/collar protein FliF [Mesobacillus zeae]RID87991.1 flagellar basal body M-ring protein FliF [Mesobacillus zeae]